MNWITLIPALLAFALRLLPGPRIVDDAYITFRYAHNLVNGHGLVFNPGQLVLGTTTPLYTLLLAGLSAVLKTDNLPQIAWLLNAITDALGVSVVFWLGKKLSGQRWAGLGAALLWAVAPFSVTFAVGGLETSLVITLLLAAFACYLAGRNNCCALLLALGTLTRPDVLIAGLLLFGAMGLRWLRPVLQKKSLKGSRFPLQPAAIFLGTLLPWLLFATLTYGSPLPHSIAAKSVAYHLEAHEGFVRFLQHLATPFHEHLVVSGPWLMVGLILYTGLFVIGALNAIRRTPRAWPLMLYPYFYTAVYALANPLIFRWYLSPPVPLYFLGILGGIGALANAPQRSSSNDQSNKRISRLILPAAIALALGLSINAWTRHPPGPPDQPAPEMAWIELETLYRQIGLDLKDELAQSGGRLAAGDIGALGWFTQAPILDLIGLISPQAKDYYPLPQSAYVINFAVSSDYVIAEQPEYIVILEVYGRNTLAQDPGFNSLYQLERDYPSDIYGSTAMQVYRRKNLP